MSASEHTSLDQRITDQASQWLVRLSADDVTAADRAAFRTWVAQDPRHRQAFDEVHEIWSDLDALSGVAMAEPQGLPESLAAEIERCAQRAAISESPLIPPPRRDHSWLRWLAAAVILSAVVGIWFAVNGPPVLQPAEAATLEYQTAVGERREVMLADGSVVWLNTDTRLLVALARSQRSVHLVYGEAYFTVAEDPLRPFVVTAGEGSITAVGTAFNVYHRQRQTRVTVLEGTVEVSRPPADASGSASTRRLHVAQLASLDPVAPQPQVVDLEPVDAVRAAAWRTGEA